MIYICENNMQSSTDTSTFLIKFPDYCQYPQRFVFVPIPTSRCCESLIWEMY